MGFSLMNKNLTVYFTLKEALYKSMGLVTIEIARVGSQECSLSVSCYLQCGGGAHTACQALTVWSKRQEQALCVY